MIVRVVRQRDAGDCGVACLAMLFDLPYEAVAQAVVATKQTAIFSGLLPEQFKRIALELGTPLTVRRAFNADNDRGIVWLSRADEKSDHVAFLSHGLVFDSDGSVWPWRAYLEDYGYKMTGLLAKKKEKRAKNDD